jgi:hypothetical protein
MIWSHINPKNHRPLGFDRSPTVNGHFTFSIRDGVLQYCPAGLKLPGSSNPPASASQVSGTTGVLVGLVSVHFEGCQPRLVGISSCDIVLMHIPSIAHSWHFVGTQWRLGDYEQTPHLGSVPETTGDGWPVDATQNVHTCPPALPFFLPTLLVYNLHTINFSPSKPGTVDLVYNPSYCTSGDWEDCSWRPARGNSSGETMSTNKKLGMGLQACHPSSQEAQIGRPLASLGWEGR